LGPDTWRVRLAVANSGYLPAYGSKRALERKVGARRDLRDPPARWHQPDPGPRTHRRPAARRPFAEVIAAGLFVPNRDITGDRAVAEWVVRAPQGTRLASSARADRAGAVRTEVSLD
jgi:hypothetical protein